MHGKAPQLVPLVALGLAMLSAVNYAHAQNDTITVRLNRESNHETRRERHQREGAKHAD
jgi:hypothetical protein